MDFRLDEDLVAVRDLAAEVLDDLATTTRVREVEHSETRIDEDLWRTLGSTGLLGVALPEDLAGAGLGLGALAVVLHEQGRRVAPVPVWSAVIAARALAQHGDAARRQSVAALADGSERVALALEEYDADPFEPACRAEPDGQGWRLSGLKALVPSPIGAGHVLVSATAPAGVGLFLVEAAGEGVDWEHSVVTTHDLAGDLRLDRAPAVAVGEPGGTAASVAVTEALVAVAALQIGVAEGALALAAAHLSAREQFGRPLATFQAVQHQLADCWIDLDAMRVTLWQAIACHSDDAAGPAARRASLVAAWWSAQAGLDVVHRTQHLHGGIGVDVDYPMHRHFLWGKQLSATLGGAGANLAVLGDLIATTEVVS